MGAIIGLQVLLFIGTGQPQFILWLVIYTIIGLPIYTVILPLYAFWNFDNFSWGTTRKVNDNELHNLGLTETRGELFKVTKLKLVEWEERIQQNNEVHPQPVKKVVMESVFDIMSK